jgi:hypothetical protein
MAGTSCSITYVFWEEARRKESSHEGYREAWFAE